MLIIDGPHFESGGGFRTFGLDSTISTSNQHGPNLNRTSLTPPPFEPKPLNREAGNHSFISGDYFVDVRLVVMFICFI